MGQTPAGGQPAPCPGARPSLGCLPCPGQTVWWLPPWPRKATAGFLLQGTPVGARPCAWTREFPGPKTVLGTRVETGVRLLDE